MPGLSKEARRKDREEHPEKYCTAHDRITHEPCTNYRMKGKKVCRMHGGKSPGAPIKHGRYAKTVFKQENLQGIFEQAIANPQLLSLRENRAILETLKQDVLDNLPGGASAEDWQKAAALFRWLRENGFYQGHDPEDSKGPAKWAELGALLENGAREWQMRMNAVELIEAGRRVTDTEIKRVVALKTAVPVQDVYKLIAVMGLAIREVITDAEQQRRISEKIRVLSGSECDFRPVPELS